MHAHDFVACWKNEKGRLLSTFLDESAETAVSTKIESLGLSSDQRAILRDVIDEILKDTFYALLLGLDGSASLGDVQQAYQIRGEDGDLISDGGDLEAEAWQQFHENDGA